VTTPRLFADRHWQFIREPMFDAAVARLRRALGLLEKRR